MAARGGENKIAKIALLRYPCENFDEMHKEIEANLWQKFENSKWPPFLGRGKYFENCKDCIA